MSNEIHKYQFGGLEVELPRKWVPLAELEDIAKDFGFQNSDDLEGIFMSLGIGLKALPNEEKQADFNGVSFYLLGEGLISAEFFSSILNHNFGDDYVPVIEIFDFIGKLMNSVKNGPTVKEMNMVVSSLKRLVA